MLPEINIVAVLLATVASMLVGWIWYAPPVVRRYWMKVVGHDEQSIKSASSAPIIVTIVVVNFMTASVLAGAAAIAQNFYGGSFLANTVVSTLILWVGFTAARMVTHDAFDRRPAGITVLNLAHELVTLTVMALIIGVFSISTA